MAIYVALPRNQAARDGIASKIQEVFPDNYLLMDSGAWLLSGTGTSNEIATRLGILAEGGPSVIILAITGYSGRAPTTVWEWLKIKMEGQPSG
jgi:hypothetical protein